VQPGVELEDEDEALPGREWIGGGQARSVCRGLAKGSYEALPTIHARVTVITAAAAARR
jgi:hypothetical protein